MPARPPSAQSYWILIPVHNRADITRRCLRHLHELGVSAWAHVVVADDGSTDDTPRMLREDFPWASVIQGDGTWWWAGAIHAAMQKAVSQGAQAVCWLNDDTLPDAGALEKLFAQAERVQGICGGLARTDDQGAGMTYSGGNMRHRWPAQTPRSQASSPVTVEWLHGNMVVVPASVWQKLGLLSARGTIHNFADIGYTYRAHKSGIPVLLLPAATAMASPNDSASYRSWRDESLPWHAVWRGFGDPKVWWYLPGLVAFKTRAFGLSGWWDCAVVLGKAAILPLYKLLKKGPHTAQRNR